MADRMTYVRDLMRNRTDAEVRERMERLNLRGLGQGHKMYDDLKLLLQERAKK